LARERWPHEDFRRCGRHSRRAFRICLDFTSQSIQLSCVAAYKCRDYVREIFVPESSGRERHRSCYEHPRNVGTVEVPREEPWKSPARNRRARREAVTGALGRTGALGVAPTLTGNDCENSFFLWACNLRAGGLRLSSVDACAAAVWGSGCGRGAWTVSGLCAWLLQLLSGVGILWCSQPWLHRLPH
jgi:hypothetical protein